MEDHHIEKPHIFISHAATDGEFANAVKQEIEKVFANGVNVFCTSSPTSIDRPWLWFEVGATWSKGRAGETRIYPLCAPEIELGSLPAPLDRLQALSMGKAADLKLLFEALIGQFGFGKIGSFRATNITSRIPKYKDVKIKEVDLNDKVFYSGRYSGYTDAELMEVIDTLLLSPDDKKHSEYSTLYRSREELIHNGKLVHFREVDRKLDLPPGTAGRLLNQVAARYGLVPELELGNVVRYKIENDA